MRPAQAAKALDISERTLRDWLAAGVVPCVRVNGVVLLPVKTLEKRLEELAELRSAPAPESEKTKNLLDSKTRMAHTHGHEPNT